MAAQKKSRNRDNDPVKVSGSDEKGWRVSYYASGVVGIGPRTSERAKSKSAAYERADQIRSSLRRGPGYAPRTDLTFGEVVKLWLDEVGPTMEDGTLKAYRSDANCYLLPLLTAVPVNELDESHFALVVDGVIGKGLSPATLDGAVRTLNSFLGWSKARKHMPRHAFGYSEDRKSVMKDARARVKSGENSVPEVITLKHCPTASDVLEFANALQAVYSRGYNFVMLMAASGLRPAEMLALRVEDLDPDEMTISVVRQLNRLKPNMTTKLPKYKRTRTALVWIAAQDVMLDAIANADEDGWLFPSGKPNFGSRPATDDREAKPGRGQWWVTRFGELAASVLNEIGWTDKGWGVHWLRHHWATRSISVIRLPPKVVSVAMGHRSLSVTLDRYVQEMDDSAALMREMSEGH